MNYWHNQHPGQRGQHPHETSWGRYSCITAPTGTIISLDDAKNHCRVPSANTDDDDYISSLIKVATATIDGPSGIGIAMLTQTWCLTLDSLPVYFRIGLGPVQSITGITYVDNAGVTQTVDPTLYRLINGTQPAQVINRFIPTDVLPESVQVRFVCGFGASAKNVPDDLKQAVRLFVSHYYDVREIAAPTLKVQEIPFSVRAILERYAIAGVA